MAKIIEGNAMNESQYVKDAKQTHRIMMVIVLATVSFGVGFAMGELAGNNRMVSHYNQLMVDKGFAQYCPDNGKFAFIDECGK